MNPYLRPLYDALYDMMEIEKAERLLERGTIEVAPIAFMRGRTLNDAFVILDEAQNTTSEQMKMFLTRLGFGSKAVVTGDITQIDLPTGRQSGLVEAMHVVGRVEGIEFVYFDDRDVVRHKLVQAIVKAYEAYGNPAAGAGERSGTSKTESERVRVQSSRFKIQSEDLAAPSCISAVGHISFANDGARTQPIGPDAMSA